MKLLLAAALAGLLFAGLFLVPLQGRTLWQRAQARGLPQSAAHAMSSGARAAWRWAEAKRAGSEEGAQHKSPRKEVARVGAASEHPQPVEHAQPGERSQLGEARYRNGEAAPTADKRDPSHAESTPSSAARTPPQSPSAAHDHIVAAPAREELSRGDRQGLDQLIAGASSGSRR
jgi:hypothetical protein